MFQSKIFSSIINRRPKNSLNNCKLVYNIPMNLKFKDIKTFTPLITNGRVIKIYDGDTITIASYIDGLEEAGLYRFSVRLIGLDTPEINSHDETEKMAAYKIRDKIHHMIFNELVSIKPIGVDNFGRILANVYHNGNNINKWLLDNKYANIYDGKKKKEFNSKDFNSELFRPTMTDVIFS
jgi:endonuclease YncB( thermonuclease family)